MIADKTVLKMMREMGIRCGIRRETAYHRYNSYRGVVGRTFENVIARDFDAGAPWQKLGTDVTEFKVAGGKAYWAPTLDFCTKEIVASDISTTPDMGQQARMLDELLSKIPEGAAPTMHSDRGWQYQHASYTSRLEAAGIVQSMSRKANCIDNAATEQLFGHVKGAFTDAYADKAGKIELAEGGTLFLDEIGNIPLHLQAKLLRVLQNRTITRVGDTKPRNVNIRLVCATNMDLRQKVQEGSFREDLFYRINTMSIHLPALRERREDIVPLAEIFIKRFDEKYHREVEGIAPLAKDALKDYHWSGNIRELQNCIEKAVILSEGSELTDKELQLPTEALVEGSDQPVETLEEVEERAIRAAVEKYSGNMSLVAKALNVSRPTLYSKLKKYGI